MPTPDVPAKGFIIGSKLYDKLKFLALVLMPAVGTLYFTLGNTWNWPNVEQVIGSITAVDTFLGVILGISSASYNASDSKYDGAINVSTSEEGIKTFSLDLNGHPEELEGKKDITFKVNPSDPAGD